MGDVTTIGGGDAEPRLWVCDCGCSTFEIREDASICCAHCAVISQTELGGWYSPEAKAAAEPERFVVAGNGCVDFVRRRLSKTMMDDDVVGLVMIRDEGTVSFWHTADTPERVKWFKRRLKQAKRILDEGL